MFLFIIIVYKDFRRKLRAFTVMAMLPPQPKGRHRGYFIYISSSQETDTYIHFMNKSSREAEATLVEFFCSIPKIKGFLSCCLLKAKSKVNQLKFSTAVEERKRSISDQQSQINQSLVTVKPLITLLVFSWNQFAIHFQSFDLQPNICFSFVDLINVSCISSGG